MAPKRKAGRAAAEAAYADLLKDNTSLVGDVGEAFDDLVAKLDDATHARERYEDARAAAVKGGAVTNEQLEQMGYKKTPKLPAPPQRVTAGSHGGAEAAAGSPSDAVTEAGPREPALAAAGNQSESNSHE